MAHFVRDETVMSYELHPASARLMDEIQHCDAQLRFGNWSQWISVLICDPAFGEPAVVYESFPATYHGGATLADIVFTQKGT